MRYRGRFAAAAVVAAVTVSGLGAAPVLAKEGRGGERPPASAPGDRSSTKRDRPRVAGPDVTEPVVARPAEGARPQGEARDAARARWCADAGRRAGALRSRADKLAQLRAQLPGRAAPELGGEVVKRLEKTARGIDRAIERTDKQLERLERRIAVRCAALPPAPAPGTSTTVTPTTVTSTTVTSTSVPDTTVPDTTVPDTTAAPDLG